MMHTTCPALGCGDLIPTPPPWLLEEHQKGPCQGLLGIWGQNLGQVKCKEGAGSARRVAEATSVPGKGWEVSLWPKEGLS